MVQFVARLRRISAHLQRIPTRLHRNRKRNAALAAGGVVLFVGLVGFERNLGPAYSASLPEPAEFLLQAMLLWSSLACSALAWYYHR